ncbi:MAG: galactokinase [Treponemataceae bacterium]
MLNDLSKLDTDLKNGIKVAVESFKNKFGKSNEKVFCAVAPARVNLVGDHIDYNGGFVFPCAINLYLYIVIRKNATKRISYFAKDLNKTFDFSLDDKNAFLYNKDLDFENYLNGTLKFLTEKNLKINSGFDVLIHSNIPIGSALSSSAALEVAFALAVSKIFNFEISRKEVALLGKRVENEFLGLQSGIMDQFIIANAKKNTCMLLNTANLETTFFNFNLDALSERKTEAYSLLVMNTCKPRSLLNSKYNERKAECEKALAVLQKHFLQKPQKPIENLCELKIGDLHESEKILKNAFEANEAKRLFSRVSHCVNENNFVLQATRALSENNLKQLGSILTSSHTSLKKDYEVTGAELDALVKYALENKACLGARMTGAGFSGCAIAIVKNSAVEEFINEIARKYKAECNLDAEFYVCKSVNAADVFEIKIKD